MGQRPGHSPFESKASIRQIVLFIHLLSTSFACYCPILILTQLFGFLWQFVSMLCIDTSDYRTIWHDCQHL